MIKRRILSDLKQRKIGEKEVLKSVKNDAIRQLTSNFFEQTLKLGFSKEEVINIINKEM